MLQVHTQLRVEKIRDERWFILICSKWQRLVSSQYNSTVHQAHLSTTKYFCKHEQHASLAYYSICIMQIEEHIQDKIKKKKKKRQLLQKASGKITHVWIWELLKTFNLGECSKQQADNGNEPCDKAPALPHILGTFFQEVLKPGCSIPAPSPVLCWADTESVCVQLRSHHSWMEIQSQKLIPASTPSPCKSPNPVTDAEHPLCKALRIQTDAAAPSQPQSPTETCQIPGDKYSHCEWGITHTMLVPIHWLQTQVGLPRKKNTLWIQYVTLQIYHCSVSVWAVLDEAVSDTEGPEICHRIS